MTYIIRRYAPNSNNDLDSDFNFLRHMYWTETGNLTFGAWLRGKGLEAITSISEEDAKNSTCIDDYIVLEIHFPSETSFLAFKLKYS